MRACGASGDIYGANRQVDSMIESRPDILFDRQIFRKINNENLHLYHCNNLKKKKYK